MMIKVKDLGEYFLNNYQLGEYVNKGGNSSVYKVSRNFDKSTFDSKFINKVFTIL